MLARLDDKEAVATLNDLRALEDFQHREFERQAQLLARGVSVASLLAGVAPLRLRWINPQIVDHGPKAIAAHDVYISR